MASWFDVRVLSFCLGFGQEIEDAFECLELKQYDLLFIKKRPI